MAIISKSRTNKTLSSIHDNTRSGHTKKTSSKPYVQQLDEIAATLVNQSRLFFLNIPRKEYIESVGKGDPIKTPELYKFIQFCEGVQSFVKTDVLYDDPNPRRPLIRSSIDARTIALENWVNIANLVINKYHDYSLGYQIYYACVSPELLRLKATHKGLSEQAQSTLKQLDELFDSFRGQTDSIPYQRALKGSKGFIVPQIGTITSGIAHLYGVLKESGTPRREQAFYFEKVHGIETMAILDALQSRFSASYPSDYTLPIDTQFLSRFTAYLSYNLDQKALYKASLECEGRNVELKPSRILRKNKKFFRITQKDVHPETLPGNLSLEESIQFTVGNLATQFIDEFKNNDFPNPSAFAERLENIINLIKKSFAEEDTVSDYLGIILIGIISEFKDTISKAQRFVYNKDSGINPQILAHLNHQFRNLKAGFEIDKFKIDEFDMSIGTRELEEVNRMMNDAENLLINYSHSNCFPRFFKTSLIPGQSMAKQLEPAAPEMVCL